MNRSSAAGPGQWGPGDPAREPSLEFCPKCGQHGFSPDTEKSYSCAVCGFVLFLNVATAVAALVVCQRTILATLRAAQPGRGSLDLPGGFVDHAETTEQALRRELREELGLEDLETGALRLLGTYPNIYPYRGMVYHTLDLVYLAELKEFPLLRPADDVAAVRWIPLPEIEPADFGFASIRAALADFLS